MSKKNLEIQEATRQKLIDSFWILYKKKDIDKIKVQEITDLAGYHRNSFYRYFPDVYALLEHIEDKIINELIDNTDERIINSRDGIVAKNFAKVWEENSEYIRVFANKERGNRFLIKMTKNLKKFTRKNLYSAKIPMKTTIFLNNSSQGHFPL
ncbi:MAG: TetR/AcrR family transcriptional regulator [Oscillospiraceae bacterium]|nr:TetR/AcrR family transcriptional regulator [Oscillospiraceae bacterium]